MLGAFWVGLTSFFVFNGVAIAVRILAGLGIGFVSYTGADFAITEAETYLYAAFDGMAPKAYSIMVMAGFSEGLKIMFAGFSTYITIRLAMGAFSSYQARPASIRA